MKDISGMALVCNHDGVITKVLHNDLDIAESALLGKAFPLLTTVSSVSKALSFLAELKIKQTIFDWELDLAINGKTMLAHCVGLVMGDDLLILTAQTRYAVHHLFDEMMSISNFDEMMSISNDQINLLRSVTKEQSRFPQTQPDHEIRLYEELSSLNNELINLQRELAKKNAELERLNIEIKRLATQDELTKVFNRRGFFELGYKAVEQAKRSEKSLAVIIIDIDFFKTFNDNYGHAIGDIVLTEVAARCNQQLRSMDILSRCGGEEFFVLLPETELDNALTIAERLRYHVCHEPVATESGLLTVTISLGVSVTNNTLSLDALLDKADHALYQAKQSGRNCVRAYLT